MNRFGVLVLHGLGGTPHSVAPVTNALRAAGYETVAPTLPGHASSPEMLSSCSWDDWLAAADAAADGLLQRRAQPLRHQPGHVGVVREGIVVVGQSMGATLALQLAATRGDVRAVAAINGIVLSADPDATAHLRHLIDRGRTMQATGEPDIRDPQASDEAYLELPLHSLLQLDAGACIVHALLAFITVPVMVVSSDHDGVVDPANSDAIAVGVHAPVTRLRLANSGHVAALDVDKVELCRQLLTWLVDLTDGSAPAG